MTSPSPIRQNNAVVDDAANAAAEAGLDITQELLATLVHACNGCATLAYIAKRLSYLIPCTELSKALRELIQQGEVSFEYVGSLNEPQGLAFFPVSSDRPGTPAADATELLGELMRLLSNRSDGRGDSWHQATWDELHRSLGKSYGADAIVDALRLGLNEGLITCAPRVEEKRFPNTDHICFYLAQHLTQTVLAYDTDAQQAICFHVRAGTSKAAARKVQLSAYGGDNLVILGICAGKQPFEAPERGHLVVEKL